ncbi:MAG: hypothetical protein NC041_04365 [Bacteroides sp.]|nr:hypothetical protein [Prevotella sp.]MCM1407940.1 hypothetical protein [Treponema brennaborense]MCM1469682.1 hypothetical protein [Bacteroides sp.]
MKRLFCFAVCLFAACFFLFAASGQTESSWHVFKQAERAFDQSDYGTAAKLLQRANEIKKQEAEENLRIMNAALLHADYMKEGKSVEEILFFLEEKEEQDAVPLIYNMLRRQSVQQRDSYDTLINRIKSARMFPEADFLLAKIYVIESEYDIAQMYFESALTGSAELDVPDMRFDILYAMADLKKAQRDTNACIEILRQIIANDALCYENGQETAFVRALVASVKSEIRADKFFLLYRNESYVFISAYFQLAEYYLHRPESIETALKFSVIGVLSAVSHIDLILKERSKNYTYSGFNNLLHQCCQYQDIVEWCAEHEIWRGLFNLALLCENINKDFSIDILYAMYSYCPEEYWLKRAAVELKEIQ